jgi:hypothetical protein
VTKKRLLWLLAIVVALALVATLVVVSCGSSKRSMWTFTVNNSKVVVEADLSGGEIVAKPATGAKPSFKTVKPLGTPVNLELKGGTLEGLAKVTFDVDVTKLPKGIDPEAWLTILVRSERTGGKWRWAGGEYDAATKKISVETEHFSDWVLGYTDFDQINADLAWSKDSGIGARLGRTIWGAFPALSCNKGRLAAAREGVLHTQRTAQRSRQGRVLPGDRQYALFPLPADPTQGSQSHIGLANGRGHHERRLCVGACGAGIADDPAG